MQRWIWRIAAYVTISGAAVLVIPSGWTWLPGVPALLVLLGAGPMLTVDLYMRARRLDLGLVTKLWRRRGVALAAISTGGMAGVGSESTGVGSKAARRDCLGTRLAQKLLMGDAAVLLGVRGRRVDDGLGEHRATS